MTQIGNVKANLSVGVTTATGSGIQDSSAGRTVANNHRGMNGVECVLFKNNIISESSNCGGKNRFVCEYVE